MKQNLFFRSVLILGSFLLSFTAKAQTCPDPTGLVITDNQDGSITITWNPVTPTPALGYAYSVVPVGYMPSITTDFTLLSATTVTTSVQYDGTNLLNGTTYTIYVGSLCSFTDAGYANGFVTINIPVLPCASVSNIDTLNCNFVAGTAEISFTSTASAFEVQVFDNTMNTNYFVTPNPTSNPFTLSGLNHGYNYTLRMRAICGAGDTSAALVKTFDFGTLPCQQPLNVVVVDNQDGTITISFDAPIPAPAQGMAVSVMNQGGFPATAADITYPVSSPYTVSATNAGAPLVHGSTYSVYVGSVCDYANNDMAIVAKTVKIFNPDPCDTVQNLGVMDNTDGSITIGWSAVNPTPSGGYGYAVVPEGEIPSTMDYKTTFATSLTNIDKTTQGTGVSFVNGEKYDVYVKTQCYNSPVWHADSVKTTILITNLGSEEFDDAQLRVYPNPVESWLKIELPTSFQSSATVVLFDVFGKKLFTTTITSNSFELDISGFAGGVYFIFVETNNKTLIKKIVKK